MERLAFKVWPIICYFAHKICVVRHGNQEEYQVFGTISGRFNSEFGMEAFPHMWTLEYFIEDGKDLSPQSRIMDFHNKADGHERRLAVYIEENLRVASDLGVCSSIIPLSCVASPN